MTFFKWLFRILTSEVGQVGGGLINLEDILGGQIRDPFQQDPSTVAGLETLQGATDITEQLGRARGRFEENILPQILARLSAAGLGRGGAVGEAVSRGFAGLAAPIEARGAQAVQNLGQAQLNVGSNQQTFLQNAIARLTGIRTNQARINASLLPRGNRLSPNFGQAGRFSRLGQSPFGRSATPSTGPGAGGGVPLTDAQVKAQQQAVSALANKRLAQFPTGASFFAPSGSRGSQQPFLSSFSETPSFNPRFA